MYRFPRGSTPSLTNALERFPSKSDSATSDNIKRLSQIRPDTLPRPSHSRNNSSHHASRPSQDESNYSSHPPSRHQSVTPTMDVVHDHDGYPFPPFPAPKSPSAKVGAWFGWKSSTTTIPAPVSPATTFSETYSPMPSPNVRKPLPGLLSPGGLGHRSVSAPLSLDIPKANGAAPVSYYTVPGTPGFSSNAAQEQIEELERELREVGTELANSIRREMELEDELERYKLDMPIGTGMSEKRTSDYYSDSGASSVRFPISDPDQRIEDLERIRRQVEQDKANLKVEMGQRLQTEMQRRKEVEDQLKTTILQAQHQQQQGASAPERQRELESSLQDAQRRLTEEKQFKENFEDLLNAMRGELESLRNERDNLREEIVPQLRAQVEGLEAEAANSQSVTYENTKMQQELDTLKKQLEAQQRSGAFGSIAEDPDCLTSPRASGGVSRSMSLVNRSRSNTLARSGSVKGLQRSNSVKGGAESPQSLTDRVKDIEEQRDALHKALKALLVRQELQSREHNRRVKALEDERNRSLSVTPRRTSFNSEVRQLRNEVFQLRRRADDALEQKWQTEKGLSGLRMDLDRAHQETDNLRDILHDHDIPLPTNHTTQSATTDALDKAHQELRTTHALSLARVMEMENEPPNSPVTAEAQRTIHLLKQSISSAEAERNAAMREAESYRFQARALQKSEVDHLSKEQSLASELYASAARMDELANNVEKQLTANRQLRQKLAEAVGRGEMEQKISKRKIMETQSKLRDLEDRVMTAQQHSEESLATHEEELARLKETHRSQLRRVQSSIRSPMRFSFLPMSDGMSVPPTPLLGGKSPRLDRRPSATPPVMKMAEAGRTEDLEKRVRGLERALKDAEEEMEEVVGRMNRAQIEVAELQAEK